MAENVELWVGAEIFGTPKVPNDDHVCYYVEATQIKDSVHVGMVD